MDLFYYFTVVFLSVKAQSSLAHHTRYFVTGRNLAAAAATRQNPRRLISVSSPTFPFLCPSPALVFLSWPPGGDDWASGGAICQVFAHPFAGVEHPPGMPAPSLPFCRAEWSTPNPNEAILYSDLSQLQYIT